MRQLSQITFLPQIAAIAIAVAIARSERAFSDTLLLPPHFNFFHMNKENFRCFSKSVPKIAIFGILDNPLTLSRKIA